LNGIRRLSNPIRQYAWGSRTALAELTGRPAPTPSPEAELWMGAHPSAPSRIETEAGSVALDAWIRREPAAVLGREVAERFSGELPFLFKVLAPERALSIQAHPNEAQAREGFERENAAGLALDDPRRCYRDRHAKPELICALSGFDVLCGFRPRAEIADGLAALGESAAALREALDDGIAVFLRALLAERDRSELADAASAAAAGRHSADWRCVTELALQYPGDAGVLAPLFLNRLSLAPGEALFLPAGELHAYLRGVGIELMGNSDNVLRGGLTPKHVDAAELLRTLSFRVGSPPLLGAQPAAPGIDVFETPAREFVLSILRPRPGAEVDCRSVGAIEILLCAAGRARICEDGSGSELELSSGDSVLVPGTTAGYRVEGAAQLFRATVPL